VIQQQTSDVELERRLHLVTLSDKLCNYFIAFTRPEWADFVLVIYE
jgi:hypothetical protein